LASGAARQAFLKPIKFCSDAQGKRKTDIKTEFFTEILKKSAKGHQKTYIKTEFFTDFFREPEINLRKSEPNLRKSEQS